MHAKSCESPRMLQWDAVDTSPDLGGQNVLKTFEMAIRYDRRAIRTELERVFCRWMYFYLRSKIVFWLSYRGGGDCPRRLPPGSATDDSCS